MILPDFNLTSRSDQHWMYSGIDSFDRCLDKTWFAQYPYAVEYHFNHRGFRDDPWPESLDDLRQAIWCIGDSFTVGVGQPFDHIWPRVLATVTGRRTINISMDGASNEWIARRAKRVINDISPQHLIVMWSYVHRRENADASLKDEDRLLFCDARPDTDSNDDIDNLKLCRSRLSSTTTHVIQAAIPNFCGVESYRLFPDLMIVRQKDIARDGHHFDILTAEHFVQGLLTHLQ